MSESLLALFHRSIRRARGPGGAILWIGLVLVHVSPALGAELARPGAGTLGFSRFAPIETAAAARPEPLLDAALFAETVPDSLGAAPAPAATAPGDTAAARPKRSLAARTGRTIGYFASDAWYVVSSPAHLKRKGAVILTGVLGIAAVLYNNDQEILDGSIRNKDDAVWKPIMDVGKFVEPVGFMPNTNPFYAAGVIAGYAFHVKPLREIPLEILESHAIAGGLRNLSKILIGRRRPDEEKGPRFFEFNGGTSFPSGHTSVLFEVATILSHHAHSVPASIVLYGLAGAGSLHRIHARGHWPSDVFLSAVSGTLVARTVVRRNEERRARLEPVMSLGDDGPRLGIGFRF